jgi:hypothetical protein
MVEDLQTKEIIFIIKIWFVVCDMTFGNDAQKYFLLRSEVSGST